MRILSGAPVAAKILDEAKQKITGLKNRYIKPGLAVLLIGDDPSSKLYTDIKKKRGEELGIEVKIYQLSAKVREATVLQLISKLNSDKKTSGIIVQMPVPKHISREKIIWAIAQEKDVDGFQMRIFMPPAPLAVLELLDSYGITLPKKKMLIIGKGFLIGKPLATLATRRGARVMSADEGDNLARLCGDAQIIVSAAGVPNLIGQDMLKSGQIIVDVGGKFVNGKLIGDVDFEDVKNKVAAIAPNPGGIGPITVSLLLKNVVDAAFMTKVKQI